MQYITIVRGRLKDPDVNAARDQHNAIVDELRPRSEPMGAVGHQAYVEPQDPGSFVAVDRWSNMEGLQQFLWRPEHAGEPGLDVRRRRRTSRFSRNGRAGAHSDHRRSAGARR